MTAKTILITGASDGIGLATAKMLLSQGHKVLMHGRNKNKLAAITAELPEYAEQIEVYIADLSRLSETKSLTKSVAEKHDHLDVLINNAGVFKVDEAITADGLDIRFAVNTIAPYLITSDLLPLLGTFGRVINLSSAAQMPVDIGGLLREAQYAKAMDAYAQSKLAITMWTYAMAQELGDKGPVLVAVNPGSLLASKMVKEGFGVSGADISIGAEILSKAALSDEFSCATGKYFDNDSGDFSSHHPDVMNREKQQALASAIASIVARI